MAGVPVKFRCYRCNQLLGVSRSKIGTTVSCPKCATDLVVPDPDDASASESAAVPASSGSASNVTEPTPAFLSALASGMPMAIPDIRPEDIRVEPGIAWESIQTTPPAPPVREPELGPEPPAPPPAAPEPSPPLPPIVPPAEPPRVAVEPVVPPIVIEPPAKLAGERTAPTGRSRDLTIPRSVVAFWSLFVLIAQALGFVAGLLAGHFLWRIP
jgi:hypothetical protein